MTWLLVQLRGKWFLNRCWGTVSSTGYFSCHNKYCPFSAKVSLRDEHGNRCPTVEKVLCPVHWHSMPSLSKKAKKDIIMKELDAIKNRSPESEIIDAKHRQWGKEARRECKKLFKSLKYKTDVDQYALKHLDASGSELAKTRGRRSARKQRP